MTIYSVDVDQFHVSFQAEVFPNPASEKLNINIEGAFVEGTIEITDFTGKVIYSDKILSKKKVINVGSYESGSYHLEISSGRDRLVREFKVK